MRLIDADKLRKDVLDLPNCYNGFSDTYDKAMILDLVDEQPTVDAEPVRHGKWINDKGLYKCSVCNNLWAHWWVVACPEDRMYKEMNYCPNCGAKMDEVRKK